MKIRGNDWAVWKFIQRLSGMIKDQGMCGFGVLGGISTSRSPAWSTIIDKICYHECKQSSHMLLDVCVQAIRIVISKTVCWRVNWGVFSVVMCCALLFLKSKAQQAPKLGPTR